MASHPETKLHMAVVAYLRGQIRSGKNVIKTPVPFNVIFLHPNNEFSDEKEAFWAVAKGVRRGAPDLLFWWQGKSAAIELKSTKGRLSPYQEAFKYEWERMGNLYAVCRSVAEVRDTLVGWGLECHNSNAIEPVPSMQERLAQQRIVDIEFFRRD